MAVPKRKMSKARRDRRCPIMYARNAATMMAKKLWQQLNKHNTISRTRCVLLIFFCDRV